jgi:hypothetical protein
MFCLHSLPDRLAGQKDGDLRALELRVVETSYADLRRVIVRSGRLDIGPTFMQGTMVVSAESCFQALIALFVIAWSESHA